MADLDQQLAQKTGPFEHGVCKWAFPLSLHSVTMYEVPTKCQVPRRHYLKLGASVK